MTDRHFPTKTLSVHGDTGQWLTQEPPRLSQLEIEMSILHGCRSLRFTSTIPSMFGVHTI